MKTFTFEEGIQLGLIAEVNALQLLEHNPRLQKAVFGESMDTLEGVDKRFLGKLSSILCGLDITDLPEAYRLTILSNFNEKAEQLKEASDSSLRLHKC